MDSTLWENGALELVQSTGDFFGEAVLENHARGERARNYSEKLVAAWVHVGCVHAAGTEEGDGGGETHLGQEREGIDGCGLLSTAEFTGSRDGGAEIEDEILAEVIAGFENDFLGIWFVGVGGEEDLHPIHGCNFGAQDFSYLLDLLRFSCGCGCCRGVNGWRWCWGAGFRGCIGCDGA